MNIENRYDSGLQMYIHPTRQLDKGYLGFMRWLAENGRLEHQISGPSILLPSEKSELGVSAVSDQPAEDIVNNRNFTEPADRASVFQVHYATRLAEMVFRSAGKGLSEKQKKLVNFAANSSYQALTKLGYKETAQEVVKLARDKIMASRSRS